MIYFSQKIDLKKFTSLHFNEIPLVQKLAREIWEEHYTAIIGQAQVDYMLGLFYSTERLQNEIRNGAVWELLFLNDKAIGYLACELKEDELYLSKIYLKAEFRGQGLGKFMLNKAIEIAQLNQKKSIYLHVNKNNKASILFYEKNAFIKKDEGIFDIGNGYFMDDYIYELKIK